MHMASALSPVPLAVFVLLAPGVATATAQREPAQIGVLAGTALSGSPLGEVGERMGIYAVPGREHEVRLLWIAPNGETWSIGSLWDSYALDHGFDLSSRVAFSYASTTTGLGYSRTREMRGVPVTYGLDLGWLHFRASSSWPSAYTGERTASEARVDAAALGASWGVEIPFRSFTLVPRARIALNYPDFGGGDGYSRLHREHDLGAKTSFGVAVKTTFPRRRD